MKCISITIKDLINLRASDIKTITIKPDSDIQLILGDNGSGKSSIMREITPLPTSKSLYGPEGYKKQVFHHNNQEITLISDYGNSKAPYSFSINGGDNLNTGGTLGVQEELIAKHLGYTRSIEDILFNVNRISFMTPGTRKMWLIDINPFNLSHIIDKHKAVASKVKACKNNISHMLERKAIIEAELLTEEDLNNRINEKKLLSDEYEKTSEMLHRLDERMKTPKSMPNLDLGKLLATTLKVQRRSALWNDVDKSDHISQRNNLQTELDTHKAELKLYQSQLLDVRKEMDKYQSYLDDMDNNVAISDLDAEIFSIRNELKSISKANTYTPFKESMMDDVLNHLAELRKLIHPLMGIGITIPNSETMNLKKNKLSELEFEIKSINGDRISTQSRLDVVKSELTTSVQNIPIDKCAQYQCPLYTTYKSNRDKLLEEEKLLTIRLNELTVEYNKLEKELTELNEWLTETIPYYEMMIQVLDFYIKYPYYKTNMKDDDLHTTINNSPVTLYNAIEYKYKCSLEYYKHIELTKLLDEKLATLAKAKEANNGQKKLVEDMLHEKEVVYVKIVNVITNIESSIDTTTKLIKIIDEYDKSIKWLESNRIQVDEYKELALEHRDYECMKIAVSELKRYKQHVLDRLASIDRVIRDQDVAKSTYENEIVNQLDRMQTLLTQYSMIEKALSPNSGILHTYTLQFLNAVIRSANIYIKYVFSYPLELEILKEDKSVDYKFPVRVKGLHVPDVSMCSEAQREIIDQCFNLGIKQQLGLLDYPIFLDEIGRTFDHGHKQSLLELLEVLVSNDVVSQMWLINHHALIWDGLANSDMLVLKDTNIMLPPTYNTHVEFEYR